MGIMIRCHGYNNPHYNVHKNMGVHYTWQNTVGVGMFPSKGTRDDPDRGCLSFLVNLDFSLSF